MIVVESLPQAMRDDAEARIVAALQAHAEAQGLGFRRLPLTLEARDGADWCGGLTGFVGRDWLYIELLAVAEAARRQGIGQRLVAEAEAQARAYGLTGLWVDTYSFQAPGFYERLGFHAVGRIADQPLGHARLFFARRIGGPFHRLIPGDPRLDAALALVRTAFSGMEGRVDPPSSIHRTTAETYAEDARKGEVWILNDPAVAAMTLTERPDAIYLGKLAVAPEARRQGLARRMIGLAINRARLFGKPFVELQTRVELTENHAVFRALGFQDCGRTAHPGYDRPTSITFRCPVPPA